MLHLDRGRHYLIALRVQLSGYHPGIKESRQEPSLQSGALSRSSSSNGTLRLRVASHDDKDCFGEVASSSNSSTEIVWEQAYYKGAAAGKEQFRMLVLALIQ